LTAAYRLAQAGADVVVLEARDRVGGRAWRLPVLDEGEFDAGCEAVDDAHTALLDLAAELGVPTMRVERWTTARRPPLEGDDLALFTELEEEIGSLAARIDPLHPESVEGASSLDAQTLGGWLADRGASPRVLDVAETWYAVASSSVPIELMSLFAYAAKQAAGAGPNGLEIRFVGGPSAVAARLATELGDCVRLGSPAVALDQGSDGVRVTLGDGTTLVAERAILAIPLTLQRELRFEPPLPPHRLEALASARYGEVVKAAAYYEGPAPVPAEQVTGDGIAFVSGEDDRVLVLFAGSRAARRPDALRALAGESPHAYCEVDWSQERYTRGSYLILGPGDLLAWGRRLAEPHARIHFAGAEASPLPSYMNGAVLAGERAAREILS
jgi:monoamine oxidase